MSFEQELRRVVRDEIRAALSAWASTATHDPAQPDVLLVSVAQAAEMLDVSRDTIYGLLALDELETVEGIGRGQKVTVASLREYVARHANPRSLRAV